MQIFWGLSLYGSLQLSLEGVLPYISHNKGMCCPKGDGFAPFWSENWYRLCLFWSGIGYGFQGNYRSGWTHCSFQFQMSKKERERFYIYIYICILCFCANLSVSDDINFLGDRSENGCEKWHFWSEIGLGFKEPRGTPSLRIPRSTPLPPAGQLWRHSMNLNNAIYFIQDLENTPAGRRGLNF